MLAVTERGNVGTGLGMRAGVLGRGRESARSLGAAETCLAAGGSGGGRAWGLLLPSVVYRFLVLRFVRWRAGDVEGDRRAGCAWLVLDAKGRGREGCRE